MAVRQVDFFTNRVDTFARTYNERDMEQVIYNNPEYFLNTKSIWLIPQTYLSDSPPDSTIHKLLVLNDKYLIANGRRVVL